MPSLKFHCTERILKKKVLRTLKGSLPLTIFLPLYDPKTMINQRWLHQELLPILCGFIRIIISTSVPKLLKHCLGTELWHVSSYRSTLPFPEMFSVGLWPDQLYRVIALAAPKGLKAIQNNKGNCPYCSITPLKCQIQQNWRKDWNFTLFIRDVLLLNTE